MKQVSLNKHPFIDGLFVVEIFDFKLYFQYVEYDEDEQSLIFERDIDVVTGRVSIESSVQLDEWKLAFNALGIELDTLTE